MATLKELRIRVQSLKNTRKITSAMKMVAASKLKKAKAAAARTEPYIAALQKMVAKLSGYLDVMDNPLLQERDVQHTRFIVFASDRGLCGGFNNNLFKFFRRQTAGYETSYDMDIIGKKAYDAMVKRGVAIHHYFDEIASKPGFAEAQLIYTNAAADFLAGKTDRVVLVYNKFISSLTQSPSLLQILPFQNSSSHETDEKESQSIDYLFEPNRTSILHDLLPKQISIQVFQALLDNAIGEHAARMTAMDNATNNANDLISSLTVKMNRARQAAITTELIEIISGAEAL